MEIKLLKLCMLKRNLPCYIYKSDIIIFPDQDCIYETSGLIMVDGKQFIKLRWVAFGDPKNKEAQLPADFFLEICEYVKFTRESDEQN